MSKNFVDMSRTPTEIKEESSPMANISKYPWGLSISLGQDELEKLGLDASDFEIDGSYPASIMMKCKSISSNEDVTGERNCVEFQITHIAGDLEEEANEPEEKSDLPSLKKHGYLRQK